MCVCLFVCLVGCLFVCVCVCVSVRARVRVSSVLLSMRSIVAAPAFQCQFSFLLPCFCYLVCVSFVFVCVQLCACVFVCVSVAFSA